MATFVWAAAAGGNWSVGGNWKVGGVAQASPPTATDDVLIGSGTGATQQNITVDAVSVCQSLDCTGYTGTFTFTASMTLSIGSGTPGPGNVALNFVAGMTFASGNSSTFFFVSTSATVQTVSFAGPTNINAQLRNVQFTGSGGSWQLTSALNNSSAGANITHTRGTLDFNGQTVSTSTFTSTSGLTRTLTLGASSITVSAASSSSWGVTSGGLTLSNNTATVTVTGASGGFFSSSMNWVGLSIVFSGSGGQNINGPSGTLTCANLTRTGTAAKTDTFTYSGTSLIVTSALNITGNSVTNRVLAASSISGSTSTWSAGSISLTNVDFMDITATGLAANAAWTGTSLGNSLGNSNITFDSPLTLFRSGAGGNFSSSNWSLSTGGATGQRVPLPQDTVMIDSGATGTVTMDMPRFGADVDFTSFVGTASFASVATTIYGSLTWPAGGTLSGSQGLTLAARSAKSITANGKISPMNRTVNAPGGTYTLVGADLNGGNSGFTVTQGTFVTNNFNGSYSFFNCTGALTRALTLGTSTITVRPSVNFTAWNVVSTGLTFSGASATISMSPAAAGINLTFAGGSQTYGTLDYTIAGNTGSFTIQNNNTFNTLNFSDASNARTLTFTAGTTNTITQVFNVNGSSGKLITVNSSTGGTAATLSYTGSGVVSVEYLSIQDISVLPTSRSVGVLIKMTSKSLTGTLTSSGVILSRAIVHRLTSSLTFTGNLIRSITRTAMTGTLSFTGTLLKKAIKPLTGNLTFTGNITKRDNKALSGNLSFIGSLLRVIRHGLTANLSFVGSLRRSAARALTGSLSFSGTISRLTRRTLTASVSFVTSFVSFIPSRFRAIGIIVSSFTQATTDSSSASVASPESRDNIETVQSKTNTESVDTNAQSSIVQSDSNERTVD